MLSIISASVLWTILFILAIIVYTDKGKRFLSKKILKVFRGDGKRE